MLELGVKSWNNCDGARSAHATRPGYYARGVCVIQEKAMVRMVYDGLWQCFTVGGMSQWVAKGHLINLYYIALQKLSIVMLQ